MMMIGRANRTMSTTQNILQHHLDAFAEQDLEAIMEDYVEDSVVITNMGTYHGLNEIEGLFEDLFADFSQSGSEIEVDQQEIEDEIAYIVWHGETPDNDYEFGTDTFLIRDDAITTQTFAGVINSKS